MDIGIIGLGRMGSGVAHRLLSGGHRVVAYNRSVEKTEALGSEGAEVAHTLSELVEKLTAPRVIWLYLPAGEATSEHLDELAHLLQPGDLVLDGSNSRYTDTLERAKLLAKHEVRLMDVGTSGGIRGKEDGYCLMIGGSQDDFDRCLPLWKTVACEGGFQLAGPVASGHYVKMVHNAIEYGMMQAYAEGVELLVKSDFAADIDLGKVASLWQHGSIIRSFLGELLEEALVEDATLAEVTSRIEDNGEGRWAVEEGLVKGVPLPVISASLFVRYQSRLNNGIAGKVVSVLRNKFGGHAAHK